MAFQTGSQINPALGAINYTPYMQGAVAGAQSIGQGIANLGQGIASGIEGYYKKKEEKAQLDQATGVVSNLIKTDPQLARYIGLTPNENGEFDQKAIAAGVKAVGAGPIIQLAQNLQAQSAAQQSENRIASAALALSGEGMGPVPVGNRAAMLLQQGYTPSQVIAAQDLYGKSEAQRVGREKTVAETKVLGEPKEKTPTPFSVAQSAFLQKNPNATPDDVLKFVNEFKSSESPTTNVNVGANTYGRVFDAFLPRKEAIQGEENVLSGIDEAITEVEKGKAFTGAGAEFKLAGAKALQFLGSKRFNDEIAATNALASIIATQVLDSSVKMKGSLSNADVLFLKDVSTGGSSLPPKETLIKLREIKNRALSSAREGYKTSLNETLGGSQDPDAQVYFKALKLQSPEAPSSISRPAAGGGNLAELARAELERRRSSNPNQ